MRIFKKLKKNIILFKILFSGDSNCIYFNAFLANESISENGKVIQRISMTIIKFFIRRFGWVISQI